MPRYLKQNGKKVPDVKIKHSWIVVPVRSRSSAIDAPLNTETYLIPSRVADYIERLENAIGETIMLPKRRK